MDIISIAGIVFALVLFALAIVSGGSPGGFIDVPSILIVIGGTVATTMISSSTVQLASAIGVISRVFKAKKFSASEIIPTIITFAEKARREGLLALEDASSEVTEPFLKSGLQLVVDGTDPELVQDILETDLSFLETRHRDGQNLLSKMSDAAPAMGMIGTLIGLIQMLSKLDDPAAIGPGMAVALLTTFYGAFLANVVLIPFKNKLEVRNAEEILMKEVIIEGLLSIQAGNNPRIIEEKLKAFLPPSVRKGAKSAEEELAEEGA